MFRRISFLVAISSLLGLASCGGGSSLSAPAGSDPLPVVQGNLEGNTTPEPEPTSRALPAVPLDADVVAKASNLDGDSTHVVLGKDALDFSQCVIEGDALVLNPDGTAIDNPDQFPAWAMYKVRGLVDLVAGSLNVECQPLGFEHSYYIGVANYSSYVWEWFGPISIPEFQLDLADHPSDDISSLGNLYFLLVCQGENSARHYKSTVTAVPVGDLPETPFNLKASQGIHEDGVEVTWDSGARIDSFEVWRTGPFYIYPEDDPGIEPNEFDGLDHAPPEWILIANTEDTAWFDDTVTSGSSHYYKVRAVNEFGLSEFSNKDQGWTDSNMQHPGNYITGKALGIMPAPDDGPSALLPLPDVIIKLVDPGTEELVRVEFTDETGGYQFFNPPEGTYLLSAELVGWVFPDVFDVEVELLPATQSYDFIGYLEGEVPPPPPPPPVYDGVYGWVSCDDLNDDLLPGMLPDVLITVTDLETLQVVAETTTNPEGFFQFLELGEGAYLISAVLMGWEFDPPEHAFIIPGEEESQEFSYFASPML